MKKIRTIVLTAVAILLVFQTVSFAIQANPPINEFQQSTLEKYNTSNNNIEIGLKMLGEKYVNNFKTCQPIHFNQTLDLFGFKFNLKFDVNGWTQDNKCEYYVTGNIDSLGKDVRESFNIKSSDETISKIAPKIICGFTQEQLNTLVEWFKENSQSSNEVAVANVLKSPLKNKSSQTKLSPLDEKVMAIFVQQQACTVTNTDDLTKGLMEIMSQEQGKL